MFGFFIGGVVNDDAVKLKTFAGMALNKYGFLSTSELGIAIENEFDKKHCYVDKDKVNFQFKELEGFSFEFHMMFESFVEERKSRSLMVHGFGKYAGFTLFAADGGNWHCSVTDGISYAATGGAKKLVQVMRKKFGIRDYTKFGALFPRMKGFR